VIIPKSDKALIPDYQAYLPHPHKSFELFGKISNYWWRRESSEGLKTRQRSKATLRMPPELVSLYISGKRFLLGRRRKGVALFFFPLQ